MSYMVHDQHGPLGQHESSGYADRFWFVNPSTLASQPSRFHRFVHRKVALGRSSGSVEETRVKVDHSAARERNSLSCEMAPIALGFKKSTKALEDDELDEYDQVDLATLSGDDEGDEESEEDENAEGDEDPREASGSEWEDEEILEIEEGGSGSGSQGAGTEGGESYGDEQHCLALDELEDVELHPDVVPRRGVKVIDNKVRVT